MKTTKTSKYVTKKIDIKSDITNRIIEGLKSGTVKWHKDWNGIPAYNYVSGKDYSGINRLMLDGGAYLSYKQAIELGGKVKKGAKASRVVFFKIYEKTTKDVEMVSVKTGATEIKDMTKSKSVTRYSNVFQQSDIEGIQFKEREITLYDNFKIEDAQYIADDYFNHYNIKFNTTHGSDRAYYSPSRDGIVMPDIRQFMSSESYYGTLFHEITHSTGHKTRLNRDFSGKNGSESYAKEELVAEIGAAILCSSVGIDNKDLFANNVAYIQSWIKALENDHNLIFFAASQAEKAVKLVLDFDLNNQEKELQAA
jgi:antirestriction protein ArdC